MPRIGYLGGGTQSAAAPYLQAFKAGLRELGHIDGVTVYLEPRWAEGRPERLPSLARQLLDEAKVDILVVVTCGKRMIEAVRRASATVPLVVATCGDLPGFVGEVDSFARPGRNTTGMTFFAPELSAKRLGILKEIVPTLQRATVLWNPTEEGLEPYWHELRIAAASLGIMLRSVEVRTPKDLDTALNRLQRTETDALLTLADLFVIWNHRRRIADFALREKLPGAYDAREFAVDGGLLAYGPDFVTLFQGAALHVDKILKGMPPGDIPIARPTRLELVVNLKTARAMRLSIPPSLLLRADQVIE